MIYRIGFGFSSFVLVVCGNVPKRDALPVEIAARRVRGRNAISDNGLHCRECGGTAGLMMYRIRSGFSSVIMLVFGNVPKMDFHRLFDHVWRWIPPPQRYNFSSHCNELALVRTDWHNSSQARKGMQNGERYREESIDDRETG